MEGNRLRCKPSQPPSPAIGPARLPSALHGNCKQMRAALATRRRQRLIGPGPSWRMLDKLGDEVLGCSLELHERVFLATGQLPKHGLHQCFGVRGLR